MPTLCRCGNGWHGANCFFRLLERGRIRCGIRRDVEPVRCNIFDHIEIFANAERRQGTGNRLSPVKYA